MASSSFALLVNAASDVAIPADRLVRAALIVARAAAAEQMTHWCTAELNGYETGAVPDYRSAPAVLMATDHYGNEVPVHPGDGKMREWSSKCPMVMGLSELADLAGAEDGGEFRVMFTPDTEARLLKATPGAQRLYRVVQRIAFTSVLAVARQRVFDWAIDHVHESPTLPGGVDLSAVLGVRVPTRLIEASPMETPGGVNLSNAQLSGPVQIVMHSAGATASISQSSGADTAALRELVDVLARAIAAAKAEGEPKSVALEAPLEELRELLQLKHPRDGWISESLRTIRTVVEGASGALLAELTKPHVQSLLAQVMARVD